MEFSKAYDTTKERGCQGRADKGGGGVCYVFLGEVDGVRGFVRFGWRV